MNAALKAAKAVIAEYDHQSLVISELERLSDDAVDAAVRFLDRLAQRRVWRPAAVRWVFRLAAPPEHVLHAVGCIEQAIEQAGVEPPQLVDHHRLALAPRVVALRQERLFAESLVTQPDVVLDQPRRVKSSHGLGELPGIFRWCADREQRSARVEVDRRGV